MNKECETFHYSGLSDCDSLFKDVIGGLVVDKGTTLSAVEALATYQAIVAGTPTMTGIYLPIKRGYENNTNERERVTSQTGYTESVDEPLPMLVGHLDKSYCDYKTLYGLDRKEKDVILFLKSGKVWHTQNSSGEDIGFRARMSIYKNAPLADNSTNPYPVYMDFQYIDDLDNAVITTLAFSIKELDDLTPVGLNGKVTTAYATGGDVTVDINKRCTLTPFANITDETSFEILQTQPGSTDLDVDVTDVDVASAAIGRYVLTIQKDASSTPADLTSGVWIRAIENDGSKTTYVSQPFLISV